MTISASTFRDANHVPITEDGVVSTNTITFTGSNTTVSTPIFRVTGAVEVRGIWGVVTTALGSNHTAAYFRLNDQTAQVDITVSTGTTLSSVAAGSVIIKTGVAATAVTLINNSAGRVNHPTTLQTHMHTPFTVVKKTAATTDIEYTYSTTETPTSGAIQFFVRWLPLSADGDLAPV